MVNVQQTALRAFEQQVGTVLVGDMQVVGNVGDHRFQARHIGQCIVQRLLEIDRLGLQVLGQDEVMVVQVFQQLLGKALFVEQIGHADGATGNLVFVGRADALAGRADLGGAAGSFTRHVQRHVVRQDQRTGFGYFQARRDFDAGSFQLVDFTQQIRHGQDDAIADIASHAGTHDAGRNQLQSSLLAADDQRMAGVVAALETHHALGVIGQPIDDLTFTFIAPLRTDDDDILCIAFL